MGNVSADGTELWLSGRYDAEVYVFDTRTGVLTHRIKVGREPHGLTVWPQPGRYSLGHTGNMRCNERRRRCFSTPLVCKVQGERRKPLGPGARVALGRGGHNPQQLSSPPAPPGMSLCCSHRLASRVPGLGAADRLRRRGAVLRVLGGLWKPDAAPHRVSIATAQQAGPSGPGRGGDIIVRGVPP